MKYGVLGGTFDPPHLAHLEIAKEVAEALELDEVVWVPAAKNPEKRKAFVSSRHRLRMVQRLIQDENQMSVSDVEVTRGGDSFAVETIKELHQVRPGSYWFIMGMDSLNSLPEWKDAETLAAICRFAVVSRPGIDTRSALERIPVEFLERVDVIETKPNPLSSSMIRDKIYIEKDITQEVGDKVARYIEEEKLYR